MRNATIALVLLFACAAFAADPLAKIPGLDAELFGVDRGHSRLGFTVRFLGMSDVQGTFKDWAATILYDEDKPERSSFTAVIAAESIDTGSEMRDKDLRGPAFFDTAKHPHVIFRSDRIERKGGENFLVHGSLTMKGVTKPVSFPMTRTVKRVADKGWGNIRIGGGGKATIRRKDFGITGNEFWGEMLSDEVAIDLSILGNRPNYDKWSYNSREKPSIGEVLQKAIDAGSVADAIAAARALKRDDYNFAPDQIGIVANRLLQHGKVREAIQVLDFGLEVHPDQPGFNARLGEAWARLGEREKALAAYRKVLAASPQGSEALEMTRRLGK